MNSDSVFFKKKNNFKRYEAIQSRLLIPSKRREKPLISIVIPTYKKLDMFKITLDSALNQKGDKNYEIVVVNDDPDDTSLKEYIESIGADNLQYYRNERNLGLFGNWNRCFELASGEWIAILNDDDYLYDFYIEDVTKIIKKYKEIQYLYIGHDIAKIQTPEKARMAFSQLNKKASTNRKRDRGLLEVIEKGILLSKITVMDHFMEQVYTHPVGALIRRDKMLDLGGYNEDFYPSSDWILNVNFTMNYNMFYYNRPLGCRSEGINLSSNINTKLKFVDVDYEFREELGKMLKLPFGHWYNCCLLHAYSVNRGILSKVRREVRQCTSRDMVRYNSLRNSYIKAKNGVNYVKYNIQRRREFI